MLGFQFASSKEGSLIDVHSDSNEEMKEEAESEEDEIVPDDEKNYRRSRNGCINGNSELSAMEYCHVDLEDEHFMKENHSVKVEKTKSSNTKKKNVPKKPPDGTRRK